MHVHQIDDETRQRAEKRLSEMWVYELSHRGQAANRVGALGEVVFERWLEHHGVSFEWLADTHFDYRILSETVEVKTKDRTVSPMPHYEASVPDYNTDHQQADWYAFLSLLRAGTSGTLDDYTRAYLVGISRASDYHSIAVRRATDEVDPSNGTKFWTACWNVAHRDLGDPMIAIQTWDKPKR